MTQIESKSENDGIDLVIKIVIVLFAFPILAMVLHVLLTFPALGVDYLLFRLGGDPRLLAKLISAVTVVLACVGSIIVCKLIWPKSKEPNAR